jgi:serine protease Do
VIAADNGQSLLILVESRVLDGSERIAVTFHDNTIADASFLKSDPSVGLTVLSVLREGLPEQLQRTAVPAELGNSYSLLLGDALIALGSPTGNAGSFACGHVTSLETPVSLVDGSFPLITTDIEGTSAGSGVLYNTDGKVVGFIAQQYAPTGTGIITAIPISLMKSTIELLSNGSPIPYLWIRGQDISVSVSEKTGLPTGIYVTEALADSPAFAAGVQPGDIITVIDDKSVLTLRALHERLMDFVPGTEVSLTVLRNGAEGYVEIPLTVQIGELS